MPSGREKRRDERGATTVEVVITAPALLLALMMIVQFGLAAHANSVARAAAEEGASHARRFDGSVGAGAERTHTYLDELGPSIIRDRAVSVERTAETATVTVTGTVISLVPGLDLSVSQSSSGPVERHVPAARAAQVGPQ